MLLTEVECPNLPTDGILSSSNNKYGDSVVMSCSDLLNFRVPGGAVGAPHTVTCTADKIWDGFDDSYNKGCIRMYRILFHLLFIILMIMIQYITNIIVNGFNVFQQ